MDKQKLVKEFCDSLVKSGSIRQYPNLSSNEFCDFNGLLAALKTLQNTGIGLDELITEVEKLKAVKLKDEDLYWS